MNSCFAADIFVTRSVNRMCQSMAFIQVSVSKRGSGDKMIKTEIN